MASRKEEDDTTSRTKGFDLGNIEALSDDMHCRLFQLLTQLLVLWDILTIGFELTGEN